MQVRGGGDAEHVGLEGHRGAALPLFHVGLDEVDDLADRGGALEGVAGFGRGHGAVVSAQGQVNLHGGRHLVQGVDNRPAVVGVR